eukprot:4458436-Pleurochrysis_carterae.AAC.4
MLRNVARHASPAALDPSSRGASPGSRATSGTAPATATATAYRRQELGVLAMSAAATTASSDGVTSSV